MSLIFCKAYCGGQISYIKLYGRGGVKRLYKLRSGDKGILMLGHFYASSKYYSLLLLVEIKILNVAIRQWWNKMGQKKYVILIKFCVYLHEAFIYYR